MAISWTKTWSASDDGTILGGGDLGNLQNDIESYTVQLSGTQTITGDKTFSGIHTHSGVSNFTGTPTFSGATNGYNSLIPYASEVIFMDGEPISWEEELIWYR